MKLRYFLFFVTFITLVSVACNLPFALQSSTTPTVTATVTVKNQPTLANSTSTPSVTPTSNVLVLIPSPTASGTPLPTGDLGSIMPTFNPTIMIPITGNGSATQSAVNSITFAPAANPQKIFVGSCGTNQVTVIVAINQPDIVGSVVLLDRLDQLPDGSTSSFGAGTTMKAIDVGKYQATITAPPAKPEKKEFNSVLDYKFAVLDIAGKLVAGSFVYNDIAVTVCKK